MKLLELVKSAPLIYQSGTALHLIGPPGVGKSEILEHEFRAQLESAYGEKFGFHDVLLPTVDAPDIRGFLVPTKDAHGHATSFFTRSAVLPTKEYLQEFPRGIMLLDERSSADLLTQKAVAPAVLKKRFGEEYLPEGWMIVSASNRVADRAGVIKPPTHLVNRERTVQIEPDVLSWSLWAEDRKIHPMLITFAKQFPGVVFSPEVPKGEGAFCTPRSFVSAATLLTAVAGVDEDGNPNMEITCSDTVSNLVSGDIGEGACAQLMSFLKLADQLPTIQEILNDPKGAKCPADLSAAYAAAQMCLHYATPAVIDKLWIYAERLPRELQVSIAKQLVTKGAGVLLNSKALGAWIAKNKALINASN